MAREKRQVTPEEAFDLEIAAAGRRPCCASVRNTEPEEPARARLLLGASSALPTHAAVAEPVRVLLQAQ